MQSSTRSNMPAAHSLGSDHEAERLRLAEIVGELGSEVQTDQSILTLNWASAYECFKRSAAFGHPSAEVSTSLMDPKSFESEAVSSLAGLLPPGRCV